LNKTTDINFRWADVNDDIDKIVRFFIDNAPIEYISHGEIQDGRALPIGVWSNNLETILSKQFVSAIKREKDTKFPETRLFFAHSDNDTLVGFSYIGIDRKSQNPYAVIYDILVSKSLRNRGAGNSMISWISEEMRRENIKFLFLESGIQNTQAHQFFKRRGFHPVSINMMKAL